MNADLAMYQAYRKIIESLVFRGGVWPHLKDTVFFYRLIALIGFCLSSSAATKALVYAMSNIGNVAKFIEGIQNTIATNAAAVRIVNYMVHRSEFASLDRDLGEKFEEALAIEKNQLVLLKRISFYYKYLYVFVVSISLAVLLFCTPRCILTFRYKKYRQLIQGNYPFTVEPNSPLYWTIFVSETCLFWFTFHVVSGVDNTFGMHCFRICGLLRLAAERFKDINPYNPDYKTELYKCIAIHQLVIRSKMTLQKAYGSIIMVNYLSSAIVMCSLLYQAHDTKNQMSVFTLIFFIAYMAMKLVQCFMHAYYGSCITAESEHYQNAIYTSKWPGYGNVKFMKEIFFILMQRTVILKTWGYFFITMQIFEKICNTTISYFFLLQTLEAKRGI